MSQKLMANEICHLYLNNTLGSWTSMWKNVGVPIFLTSSIYILGQMFATLFNEKRLPFCNLKITTSTLLYTLNYHPLGYMY